MGAVQDLLTDRMDVWVSAIRRRSTAGRGTSKKLELYGVQKLRELILELAVRGLLVPQDSTHEPAIELLKQIAAEKAKLLEEGKIKKEKPLPPIDREELPYELPRGWEWARIADIGYDFGQKIPSQNFTYVDVGAIDNRLGFIDKPTVLSANEAPSRARKIVKNGTVIYSTVRPYLLNIAIVQKDFDPEPIASTAFAVIHPFTNVSSGYIYRYLRSPSFISYVESVQTGIAYPAINDKQFFSGLLPLPPTAEQDQIVIKVDELMALCDQLEQQTDASLSAHQTLVETLLNALTSAADHTQFASSWQRIAEHFDTLFTTEESIDQLKQTILQLAVMGKLIPQEPSDEPACDLLKKITDEKTKLVKEGRIKKDKLLPIGEEENPFVIPASWLFIKLGEISNINGGYAFKSSDYSDEGMRVIRISDFDENGIKSEVIVRHEYTERLSQFQLLENCILMAMTGGTVGKSLLVKKILEPMLVNQRVASISVISPVSPDYINILVQTKLVQDVISEAKNSTNDNISMGDITGFMVPLPPLAEQHRIVAKVDELMAVCDQLKSRLSDAKTTQLQLADSLTEKALAPA